MSGAKPAIAAILFAREPRSGCVKTRLASAIGDDAACRLYEAFLADCLAGVEALGLRTWLALTPESSLAAMGRLHPEADVFHQIGDDLGQRMAAALARAFVSRHAGAVIFGSDSPMVPLAERARVVRGLADAPVVLAPDDGGGFYAIAARSGVDLSFLADLSWGHDKVLAQVGERLARCGVPHLETRPWPDVDDEDDLKRLLRDLGGVATPEAIAAAPRTMGAVAELGLA